MAEERSSSSRRPRDPQGRGGEGRGGEGRGGEGRGGEGRGAGGRSSADADDAALRQLRGKLSGVLRRLPDVERRVLELRMGLVDGTPAKPGEVAQRLGMSIPEVKKVEARAFERIREVGSIKGLERFLGR